jgi:nucleoside-diphosphate-sugar epimerase
VVLSENGILVAPEHPVCPLTGRICVHTREAFDPESADPSGNLRSYTGVPDVVSLVEAALDAEFDGNEIFNAFEPDDYLGIDTTTAVRAGYLTGEEPGFSVSKAGNLLGWQPEHSWRNADTGSTVGLVFA